MMRRLHWSLMLVALTALGCAHARSASGRFIQGRPPEYRLPEGQPTVEEFVERVRRAQAEAVSTRVPPVIPTLEIDNRSLAASLGDLARTPTAAAHRRVAVEYLRAGVRDAAAEHYSAAIVLSPRDSASYEMRARIWRDCGFPGNGLADAYRAIYFAPLSPAPHNTLGTLFHRLGRFPAARAQYEEALRIDSDAGYARVNLCSLDLAEGLPAQAVDSCSRAVAQDAASNIARRNLVQARALADAAAEGSHARQ
jgi:tetratricopeptide (TPR) repeat protein